jgi:ornithine carbamoyltransferase
MSIADVTAEEFATLVKSADMTKKLIKESDMPVSQLRSLQNMLAGQTIAMMFSKRSTRTRVSMEGAIAMLGGHPMFLGKDDIQLGV